MLVANLLLDSDLQPVLHFPHQWSLGVSQDILLINLIIEHMICDSDPELGGAVQLMGLLRTLVDPENMMATANVSRAARF